MATAARRRLTFSIGDATPIAGANPVAQLDDDVLAGGDAGGTDDDIDAANLVGTLSGEGGDVPLTWAFLLTGAPAGFSYVSDGAGGVLVQQGGITVLTITLDPASGAYTVTQNAPIVHAAGGDENNQGFTLAYTVTDVDGGSAAGTLAIDVDDDTPVASASTTQPVLTVDESDLATNATASFAGVFTTAFGADGPAPVGPIAYTLGIAAGSTGLIDTATGEAVVLSLEGGQVVGRAGAGGTVVFTVSVDAVGNVTLDQQRAVVHPNAANPDDPVSLAADGLVTLTATVTDGDGDSTSAIAAIGTNLTFEDSGPVVTASTTQPVLTVDESDLATNATASFAGVFTTAFGADGPAPVGPITYALGITAGSTGLIDTATGEAVNLVLNGGVVEGRTAVGNLLVFTVSVDALGNVTLDQQRAVVHPNAANPDDPVSLAADSLVTLTATVTDRDGDSTSATAAIGTNLTFEDSGPVVTASTTQPVLTVDESDLATNATASFAGVFTPTFGADGVGNVAFALGITAGSTGLIDTATGNAVVLSLEGGQVVGRAGAGGAVVFTVSVNALGFVTLDQQRAVVHPNAANPDDPVSAGRRQPRHPDHDPDRP